MSSVYRILFFGLLNLCISCSGQSVHITTPASDSLSIPELQTTTFVCEAISAYWIKDVKISWYRTGCKASRVSLDSNVTRTLRVDDSAYVNFTSVLTYVGSRHDDGCLITCSGASLKYKDNIAHSQRQVRLNIHFKAAITSFSANGTTHAHQGFSEGSTISLACVVDSNPGSNITVLKNGNPVASRSNTTVLVYTVNNATWQDAATYTCVAHNRYNTDAKATKGLQLFVTYKPRPVKNVYNRTMIASLHDNVTFVLVVRAYPLPEFTWWKQSRDADNWTQLLDDAKISSSDLKTSMTIGNIRERDFGQYKVVATNSEGSFERYISISKQVIETTRDKPEDSSVSTGVYWGVGVCLVVILAAIVSIVVVVVVRKRKEKDSANVVQEVEVANQYEDLTESNRDNREYAGLEQGAVCAADKAKQLHTSNQYECLSDKNKETREYAGIEPGQEYINETEEHEYDYVT